MCYLKATASQKTYAWVGDSFESCRLSLFCDADFAGEKDDAKSTSGVFMAVIGPRTFVPLSAISKKQGCVSESTCESEIASLAYGLNSEGLPGLDLWQDLAMQCLV